MSRYFVGLFSIMLFSGCFTSSKGVGTSSEFRGKYKQFFDPGEIEIFSWYHYVTTKTVDEKYVLRIFYPEKKQLTSKVSFQSKNLKIKEGLSQRWFDSGNFKSEGNFHNNKENGHWKFYYYKDNIVNSEGKFDSGKETGLWKFYDYKGKIKEEIIFQNGIKEGEFTQYDSLGTIVNQGIYKSDTIYQQSKQVENLAVGEQNMPYMSSCHSITNEKERKECSDNTMLQYIYKNIKYPQTARNFQIEGRALIRFVINKDGSITIIETLSGICESIEKECIRIIKEMPDWKAGKQDGKPVKVFFNLPVKFNLN